ncbi:1-deoxypentalenic acid 11-beta-hydroxylase-like [Pecten maximus]|uniref:1-deoxypentalenic acid 11-beta-hydroxylase-like n=1 Tax=Pecten maximus TaxID=6579 RepID=UPI001458AC0E|nr:1-deoxypentalenic acid 11-beta-hydroxylase-like [Pecten maximus]
MAKIPIKPVLAGYTGEEYADVFDKRAMPKPTTELKVGQLSEEDVRKFFEDGYILVKDVFRKETLEACKAAINEMVEDLAQSLYKAGKITDLCRNSGFPNRLIQLEKQFAGTSILFIKQARLMRAFKDLWTDEVLLNIIEQLIGPDIAGHPVWNLRAKIPRDEATTVPWHQDSGYLDTNSYRVLQPTAWIPFVDTTESNGCLQIMKGGHKSGKVATHQCCHGGTWYVMLEEEEMEKTLGIDVMTDLRTCPVPLGSMLLFNNLIPHRSLNNVSDHIRWSVDLRWQNPHHPYGYYDLKEGVVFRTKDNPNPVVDWDKFEGVDRFQITADAVKDKPQDEKDAEFDTSIQGPWMKKWEIVHMNQHVLKMQSEEKSA